MAFHAANHGQAVQLQIDRLKAAILAERLQAAVSLGAMGRRAGLALVALTEALQDMDPQVRKAAALALGHLGPGATAAVAALVLALRDESAAVRWGAAEALGNLGVEATTAIRSLQQASKEDPEECVRKRAALAREKIDLQIKAAILLAG